MPLVNKYLCDKITGLPADSGQPCHHEVTPEDGLRVILGVAVPIQEEQQMVNFIKRDFCGDYHANFWISRVRLLHPSKVDWEKQDSANGMDADEAQSASAVELDHAALPDFPDGSRIHEVQNGGSAQPEESLT